MSESLRSGIRPSSANRGAFHKLKKNRSEPAVIAKRLTALSIQVRIKYPPSSNPLLYTLVMQVFSDRLINCGRSQPPCRYSDAMATWTIGTGPDLPVNRQARMALNAALPPLDPKN
jgi:hypothetical protein